MSQNDQMITITETETKQTGGAGQEGAAGLTLADGLDSSPGDVVVAAETRFFFFFKIVF